MSTISPWRIARMRAVSGKRVAAAAKPVAILAYLALNCAEPPNMHRPLGGTRELAYDGYQRAQVSLLTDPAGLLRMESNAVFPAYKGRYPALVTHVTLWDAACTRRFDMDCRHYFLQAGDAMHWPPNSIAVPDIEFWSPA